MAENKMKNTEKEAFAEDVVIGNIKDEQAGEEINDVEGDNDEEAKVEPEKKPKEGKLNILIDNLFGGRFFTNVKVMRQIPFVLFITLLALIYIANNNHSDKTVREIESIKKELKELRSEHISVKSELNKRSSQSEIASQLEETGLKESVVPPQKIFVDLKEVNSITGEKNKNK
ncbi:MAG: FtsL-like putative cell division protein [Bacteroidota bacterium]|nr:FtsL-like putative cell division protein [Bacteroidota bacterium]